jgi:hypothetical protein
MSQRNSHTHCQAPRANANANFCDKREQRQTRLSFAERSKNQRS